ncbi:hypothetical protein SDC9_187396 [bioreactor metagenome]|uniref:Uncharacterized protein n=1 Tax=bioreactor metagenome TaxID=1076179 RepID=A0A645HN39_9ZZZZ
MRLTQPVDILTVEDAATEALSTIIMVNIVSKQTN